LWLDSLRQQAVVTAVASLFQTPLDLAVAVEMTLGGDPEGEES
jgi:hypothetical protein